MAIVGNTLPHCTGTGTQADPYIFNSAEGFKEVIAVEACYAEASQSNLVFDCNDGVLTAPIIISCAYLDCKGLTILNALINQTNSYIIRLADATDTSNQFAREIKNLNVYNFCNIHYSTDSNSTMGLLTNPSYEVYGGTVPPATFTNCNFAGMFIGYTTVGSYYPIVGHYRINNDRYANAQLIFNNCTFNFHFKNPVTNQSGVIRLFAGSNTSPVKLTNCSVSLSGNIPRTTVQVCGAGAQYESYALFDTVTVTNSQSNPLVCASFAAAMPQGGYNYYKAYITTTGYGIGNTQLTIADNLGLINKDRLSATASNKISLTGIVMQETDPTAVDYIYNDANLESAGFLVGQVIT